MIEKLPADEINAILDKWIAALRSGEYKQTKGFLKVKKNDGFVHCCLGVLCEVMGMPSQVNDKLYSFLDDRDALQSKFLPQSVQRKLGMHHYGKFGKRIQAPNGNGCTSLAQLNDHGMDFAGIAQVIDENREALTSHCVRV